MADFNTLSEAIIAGDQAGAKTAAEELIADGASAGDVLEHAEEVALVLGREAEKRVLVLADVVVDEEPAVGAGAREGVEGGERDEGFVADAADVDHRRGGCGGETLLDEGAVEVGDHFK